MKKSPEFRIEQNGVYAGLLRRSANALRNYALGTYYPDDRPKTKSQELANNRAGIAELLRSGEIRKIRNFGWSCYVDVCKWLGVQPRLERTGYHYNLWPVHDMSTIR